MFTKKSFVVAGFAASLLVAASMPASATSVSYIMDLGGSAFATPGNYGTVLLDDNNGSSTVTVTVSLTSPYVFVSTGSLAGSAVFLFNLGSTGATLTNFSAVTLTGGNAGGYTGSPFGTFEYGIFCSVCSPSTSTLTSLSFDVLNTNLAAFTSTLSTLPPGSIAAYFSADIFGCTNNLVQGACTGNVGYNSTPSVPEPTTLALLGLGLLGVGAARRRRA